MTNPADILPIAGSDPSGGAGGQGDIKTFSALGCYGMAVMSALTAQNTLGVQAVDAFPRFRRGAIDAIFADIRVDAVKIGMIGAAENVAAIAANWPNMRRKTWCSTRSWSPAGDMSWRRRTGRADRENSFRSSGC